MTKPPSERLPHGATLALVMDKLLLLSTHGKALSKVSRQQLLDALAPMADTTVDDRLRTLVQQGRVTRCGRGLYVPYIPMPTYVVPAKPAGTKGYATDSNGGTVFIEWQGRRW